jgi:hypothetical protein
MTVTHVEAALLDEYGKLALTQVSPYGMKRPASSKLFTTLDRADARHTAGVCPRPRARLCR